MTIEEAIAALQQAVDDGRADMDDVLMLDIAGRWTGIKGITDHDESVFIESED